MIQLTLSLKMTTAQVVKTSVIVKNISIQDYVHPDDHAKPTYEMTPLGSNLSRFHSLIIIKKKGVCENRIEMINLVFRIILWKMGRAATSSPGLFP